MNKMRANSKEITPQDIANGFELAQNISKNVLQTAA